MNLAVHNPEFSDGYSITELLIWVTTQANQIVIQASQLVSKDKQIVDLTSQNADLTKQIVDLTKKKTETKEQFTTEKTALLQRIEELERSATLDSTNSCKPPSSDGLRKSSGKKDKDKKKRTKSSREKSGRKSGGQPGHKGNTLKQVDNPDEIINILPEQCPNCQTEFSLDDSEDYVRRQVFDVPPPPPPVVTEHRAHICKCKGCGEEFKGEFPANVTAPVQYGFSARPQAFWALRHCRAIPRCCGESPSHPEPVPGSPGDSHFDVVSSARSAEVPDRVAGPDNGCSTGHGRRLLPEYSASRAPGETSLFRFLPISSPDNPQSCRVFCAPGPGIWLNPAIRVSCCYP